MLFYNYIKYPGLVNILWHVPKPDQANVVARIEYYDNLKGNHANARIFGLHPLTAFFILLYNLKCYTQVCLTKLYMYRNYRTAAKISEHQNTTVQFNVLA